MSSSTIKSELATLPFIRADRDPHGPCLTDDKGPMDNAAFAAAVRRLTARLGSLGVSPGDIVAAMAPNCSEIVTALFAAWTRGASLTPINPALTDDEVRYQLEDSMATVVVGDNRAGDLARSVGAHWVDLKHVHGDPGEAAPEVEAVATASDFALVIYTSGTTGKPKGVLLDHANLEAMSASVIDTFALTPADRSLLVLPLFHVNGLIISVLSVLRSGGSVIIAPRFSADTFWDLVETHRPTFFSAVPTIYAVLDAKTDRQVDTSSLRFVICGAAPMPAELISRFEEQFKVSLVEGYGLSEGSVASTVNPVAGPRKPGTVGRAMPGQEVAIVSAAGEPQPQGEAGEVVIRGANVMRGYLGKPEETGKVVRDGWLHTGDVGYLDRDGYLVLVDRIKDMIIRGGENIYPKEIETTLYQHPAVLEAAVVGRPDPVYGEVPVAFVAAKPGLTVTADDLFAHCAASLARYKVPVEIHVRTELPKNSVGKLVKGLLREQVTGPESGRPPS